MRNNQVRGRLFDLIMRLCVLHSHRMMDVAWRAFLITRVFLTSKQAAPPFLQSIFFAKTKPNKYRVFYETTESKT